MATISTKSFKTLVNMVATATQGTAAGLVDFTTGSILRASGEAFAHVVLWLQGQILKIVAMTRASTCSTDADLDSWMADFDQERLAAVAASGTITLTRYTSTSQGVAPVGALVSKADGSAQYAITADSTNGHYSASYDTTNYPDGVYLAPAGITSILIPAEASTGGTDGNADAATITLIVSDTITGFDTVTNASAFTGGRAKETNAEFRARFIEYMGSLRTSNAASIKYAISSVQAGIRYKIVNGKAYSSLASKPGYFFVLVCNAAGLTPTSLISAVQTAIDAVVAEGVQYDVKAPNQVTVAYAMTLSVYPSTQASAAATAAKTAIANYINTLDLGAQTISRSRLAKIAYSASDYIEDVLDVTINGTAEDLVLTDLQMPVSGMGSISTQ